jgi:hypothetical protein
LIRSLQKGRVFCGETHFSYQADGLSKAREKPRLSALVGVGYSPARARQSNARLRRKGLREIRRDFAKITSLCGDTPKKLTKAAAKSEAEPAQEAMVNKLVDILWMHPFSENKDGARHLASCVNEYQLKAS